jgi:hypothetical protein
MGITASSENEGLRLPRKKFLSIINESDLERLEQSHRNAENEYTTQKEMPQQITENTLETDNSIIVHENVEN